MVPTPQSLDYSEGKVADSPPATSSPCSSWSRARMRQEMTVFLFSPAYLVTKRTRIVYQLLLQWECFFLFVLFGLFLKRKKNNNGLWAQLINLFFIIFCHQLIARHCVKILKIMTIVDTSTVSVNIYTGLIMCRALL